MIVITTPTGDIGHQVLKHVVQGSEPVRVIARDPSRIPQEIRQRIEVIQGSHGDTASVEKALTGADALFWLIPPEPFMNLNNVDEAYADFTKPAAEAIKKRGVKRVVSVSGIGRGWNKEAGLATANIKADDVLAGTGVALRALDDAVLHGEPATPGTNNSGEGYILPPNPSCPQGSSGCYF